MTRLMSELPTKTVIDGLFECLPFATDAYRQTVLNDFLELNGAPVLHVAKNDGTVAKIVGKLAIEEYRRDNKVIEINRAIYEQKLKNQELEELGLL